MDLLDSFALGHDLTIYNILGPIMLTVLALGVALFHLARNPGRRRHQPPR